MDTNEIKIYKLYIFRGEDSVRKSFTLSRKTAEKWKEFVSAYSEKSAILDCALNNFMEECSKGCVGFEIEVRKDNGEKNE